MIRVLSLSAELRGYNEMVSNAWGEPIPPGKSCRWRVKNGRGEVSSQWIISTSRNHDDVYLVTRSTKGISKISFHASGIWNVGLTTEAAKQMGIGPKDRHLLQLSKRDDLVPGWILAIQICVPNSQLRFPFEEESSKTKDIPASLSDDATIIEIYFQESGNIPDIELHRSYPVGVLRKSSGASVWVVARSAMLPWKPEEKFRGDIENARTFRTKHGLTVNRDHLLGHDEPTGAIILLEMDLGSETDGHH